MEGPLKELRNAFYVFLECIFIIFIIKNLIFSNLFITCHNNITTISSSIYIFHFLKYIIFVLRNIKIVYNLPKNIKENIYFKDGCSHTTSFRKYR